MFVENLSKYSASDSGSFNDSGHYIIKWYFWHLFTGRTYFTYGVFKDLSTKFKKLFYESNFTLFNSNILLLVWFMLDFTPKWLFEIFRNNKWSMNTFPVLIPLIAFSDYYKVQLRN